MSMLRRPDSTHLRASARLTRRAFIASAAAAASIGLVSLDDAILRADDNGPADLAPFDDMMNAFVKANDVPGASLAVTHKGRLVYAKGFGKRTHGKDALPVERDTPFRIASISKPFTSAGILKLVERKKVDLDRPVLDYFSLDKYLKGDRPADTRWSSVTVRNCLQHTSGMDRDKSGDPIVMLDDIKAAFGIGYPIPPEAVVAFALRRPLDADPGERYAYSNVGYLILGRIIEAVTGKPYGTYIEEEVLKPAGIHHMRLARALPENRPREETAYFDHQSRKTACIYPPKVGQPVPLADGGYNVEAYEAHGGWVASAIDLVRFASTFDDPAKSPLLSSASIKETFAHPKLKAAKPSEAPVYYGCGWSVRDVGLNRINTWHTGLLIPGTSSILVRRWDELNWAVLFNTDVNPKGVELAGLIDPLVHRAADEVKVWPKRDLFNELSH